MLKPTIEITVERYTELIRKEVGYEYRKNELASHSYISEDDRFIFGIKKQPEPLAKADDF